MANPVAGVEKIIKLGLAIKDAVDTVRHNEEECNEIRLSEGVCSGSVTSFRSCCRRG